MSTTIEAVVDLVARGEIKISAHGYDEMAGDNILVRDVVDGLSQGIVVEDYPEYPKGPCVLVLQRIAMAARFTRCGGSRKVRGAPLWC